MSRVRTAPTVLRYAVASGFADFAVVYTWRGWLFGWLSRVLCQVAFFALIGRLLGSATATRYLLIGNAVLIAVIESTLVIASSQAERRAGTLPLLLAAPTSLALVFTGRGVQWLASGTASASIALFALAPAFGVRLPLPGALLAVPLIAAVSASAYALGLCLAALVLRAGQLRNLVGNLTWWLIGLGAGVQVPATFWPRWLRVVAAGLPATHGLHAIRAVTGGDWAAALRGAALELAVGSGWLALAVLAFHRFARRARRHGNVDFGD
jgi:ABC-2 type transport system permease protein